MSRPPSRDDSTRSGEKSERTRHPRIPLPKTPAHSPDLGAHRINLASMTIDPASLQKLLPDTMPVVRAQRAPSRAVIVNKTNEHCSLKDIITFYSTLRDAFFLVMHFLTSVLGEYNSIPGVHNLSGRYLHQGAHFSFVLTMFVPSGCDCSLLVDKILCFVCRR